MAGVIRPGRPSHTEMSFGASRFPDPTSDYQTGTNVPWAKGPDKKDMQLQRQAEARLDPTSTAETTQDMYTALGNPDMFGPDQPLVQEKPNIRKNTFKQPVIRTGVSREQ
jgi:hypothetical protein